MSDRSASAEPYVAVFIAHGEPQALVIKSKLESEGIPAKLSGGQLQLVYPTTVDGLAEIKILVPERQAAEARRILAERDADH